MRRTWLSAQVEEQLTAIAPILEEAERIPQGDERESVVSLRSLEVQVNDEVHILRSDTLVGLIQPHAFRVHHNAFQTQ
jgi:hypothetical protein